MTNQNNIKLTDKLERLTSFKKEESASLRSSIVSPPLRNFFPNRCGFKSSSGPVRSPHAEPYDVTNALPAIRSMRHGVSGVIAAPTGHGTAPLCRQA